jgi:predicted transposase YbfD/YdcC
MEVSMPTVAGSPLLTALSQVPDFRQSKGRRHPLVAVLALAVVAVLCGARSLTAISQWGREHSEQVLEVLGFTHFPGPCVATLHRIFSQLDVNLFEQILTAWLESWLFCRGGLALDGKTLRGSGDSDSPPVQLLAAFVQTLGVVLGQQAIRGQDQIAAAIALLQGLDLHGWIITGDAGLTSRALAQTVIDQGGEYVLTVKANQAVLYDDIATLFSESRVVAETITKTRQVNLHGRRIEQRAVEASTALAGYSELPGLQQVMRIERRVTDKQTGTVSDEITYGVASLTAAKANAKLLAGYTRGHWGIENRLHWVRDVDYGEDVSRVRTGNAPQVMAAIRNVAINLMRLNGFDSVAEAIRHYAAHQLAATFLVTKPLRIPSRVRSRVRMK